MPAGSAPTPTPAELSELLAGAMAGRHTVVLPAAKDGRVHVLSPEAFTPCPERPGDQPPALVVFTSGSTGAPKGVALSAAALTASGRATERWLGGPGTWYLPLAPHHIAGAQVLLRSLMAGTQPLVSLGHFDAERFAEDVAGLAARVARAAGRPGAVPDAVTEGRVSEAPEHGALAPRATVDGPPGPPASVAVPASRLYASLVPTQLVRILRTPAARRAAARFDAILLGGASVAPSVLSQAADAGLRIVRTYGMSETGGGCVYDGVPFDEVDMDIDGFGRVVLSGAVLADGYVDFDAEAGTLRARPDGDSGFGYAADGVRRFTTSDLGRITDGVLDVLGRADDVIVVGAENIAPLAVENALLRALEPHGVSEVLITSVPDEEWGAVLVALVRADTGEFAAAPEPRPDSATAEGRARAAAASRVTALLPTDGSFPGIWRPRCVLPVPAIPARGIGKPDRRAARELAARLLAGDGGTARTH